MDGEVRIVRRLISSDLKELERGIYATWAANRTYGSSMIEKSLKIKDDDDERRNEWHQVLADSTTLYLSQAQSHDLCHPSCRPLRQLSYTPPHLPPARITQILLVRSTIRFFFHHDDTAQRGSQHVRGVE